MYASFRRSFAPCMHTLRIFTDGPIDQELVRDIPSPNFPSLKRIIVYGT